MDQVDVYTANDPSDEEITFLSSTRKGEVKLNQRQQLEQQQQHQQQQLLPQQHKVEQPPPLAELIFYLLV